MRYLNFWSLSRKPFVGSSSFFAGVPQREAMAGLNYFVSGPLDSAFLAAPAGCGASRLLSQVVQMHGFGDHAVEIVLTDGSHHHCDSVVQTLANGLGFDAIANDVSSSIEQAVEASGRRDVQTVWLIDRCSEAAAAVASQLVERLASLSVVMTIPPESLGRRVVEFGSLGMQIDLPPLSPEDTVRYVRYGLQQAGGVGDAFADSAAVRLHELTDGVLSELSVMAEAALALAANHRLHRVCPAVVEATDEQMNRTANRHAA